MYMIRLAAEFDQPAAPGRTDVGEDFAQSVEHLHGQAPVPVFNCEDDVIVQAVSRMIACLESVRHGHVT
nr:hypothetical protein [Thiomonas sp. FB-Cd]